MLNYFKPVFLFLICFTFNLSLAGQGVDSVLYSKTDSLQDVQLERMERNLGSLRLQMINEGRANRWYADSIARANKAQSKEIISLNTETERLRQDLAGTRKALDKTNLKLEETRHTYAKALFIISPLMFLMISAVFISLYLLISKYKARTESHLITLRKYTYEGMAEIRGDYLSEIKRRMKKMARKFQVNRKTGISGTNPKKPKKKDKSKKTQGKGKK